MESTMEDPAKGREGQKSVNSPPGQTIASVNQPLYSKAETSRLTAPLPSPSVLVVPLDRSLIFTAHIDKLNGKITSKLRAMKVVSH